MTFGAIEHRNF
jgi:hypothetical protein